MGQHDDFVAARIVLVRRERASQQRTDRKNFEEARGRTSQDTGYGSPNPNAPKELSQFGFLIGKWRCESKVKGQDGKYQT